MIRVTIDCDTEQPKRSPQCAAYTGATVWPYGQAPGVVTAHDMAQAAAMRSGWRKEAGKWYCPVCWHKNKGK